MPTVWSPPVAWLPPIEASELVVRAGLGAPGSGTVRESIRVPVPEKGEVRYGREIVTVFVLIGATA